MTRFSTTHQVNAPLLHGAAAPSGRTRQVIDLGLIAIIILHLPLAVVQRNFPILASLHALAIFFIGLWAVLLRPKDDLLHLWAVSYIVGGEVLWRLTATGYLPHEFGKYAIVVIIGIAVLRRYRRQSLPILPVVFMACLLPGLLFFVNDNFTIALMDMRYQAIGSLLGPLSLALCTIYFWNLALDSRALKSLAFIAIAPTVAMAAYIVTNVVALGETLRFGLSSNDMVTEGMNAGNQVSNNLAFGAILCWLLISRSSTTRSIRLLLLGAMGAMVVVAMVTFSRGGVFTFGLAVIVTLPIVLKDSPNRWMMVLIILLVGLLAYQFIWPWFDTFTSGFGVQRFSSLDASSRWDLARSEIRVWLDNPFFGVGPGFAMEYVDDYFIERELQAHVEYTRLLAEHGLHGLLALIVLAIGGLRSYRRAWNWEARMWAAALLVYAFAYMAQAATRTVTPGFTYGLTSAALFVEKRRLEEQ